LRMRASTAYSNRCMLTKRWLCEVGMFGMFDMLGVDGESSFVG
jgi:hypothetical protein